jgi:hypothetical protein
MHADFTVLAPVSWPSAGTATALLARFNTTMLWLVVKLDFIMQNLLGREKTDLWKP